MGNVIREQSKKTSVINERTILKKVWNAFNDNLQYHGNVFFLRLFKKHPHYTKYFTLDPNMPLTIDVYISTYFYIILETMGYLMINYHRNRKQFDYLIGYVAMMHKDLNLIDHDMNNFGESLIEYLIVTFPMIMTSECQEITSTHILNIMDNISKRLKILKTTGYIESNQRNSLPFMRWISCQDNLIYGKTVEFWNDRKSMWEARLNEWKYRKGIIRKSRRDSTTTDDDVSSRSESEETDNSRIHEKLMSFDDSPVSKSHQSNLTFRIKKIGETQYSVVEINNPIDDYQRTSRESSQQPSKSIKIDSIARKRQREKLKSLE